MSYNVLIADDEEAPRFNMRDSLSKHWPEAQLVAMCVNGVDAWDSFLEYEPQVCFLDIKMPGLSGFEVARKITAVAPNCSIVFCTAYGEHALEAFDAGAIDYLLKPIDTQRLLHTIDRVQLRLKNSVVSVPAPAHLTDLLNQALALAVPTKKLTHIQASVGKEIRLIDVQKILFFESDTRYTRLIYRDSFDNALPALSESLAEALIRKPLKELLIDLDSQQFWQVHRSTIVNSQFIKSAVRVDEGVMNLTLHYSNQQVSVSRQFQGLFKGQ
jgi:DNA-binding LytR/AlgR family response regulator